MDNDTHLYYAIRTIDQNLAYSGWSDVQDFWVNKDLPAAPTNFVAVAGDGQVKLYWTASTAVDLSRYLIAYKEEGGSYGEDTDVGTLTSYTVQPLTNNTTYVFRIVAENTEGDTSEPEEVSATPTESVKLNGVPVASLADAALVAQAGDTITLGLGTFILPASFTIRQGINLTGLAPGLTILDAQGSATGILIKNKIGAPQGTFSNVMLKNAKVGIYVRSAPITIKNTVIANTFTGIKITKGSKVTLTNNTFTSNITAAISINGARVILKNNIVYNNSGRGVVANSTSTVTSTYNNYANNTLGNSGISTGTGDISVAVQFMNTSNNDYREKAASGTVNAGNPADDYSNELSPNGDRINMGAFGNTIWATQTDTDPPYSW
jgi:hypothetical protein